MSVSSSRERPPTAERAAASEPDASSPPDLATAFGAHGLDEPDPETAHALRLGYIRLDGSGVTVYLDVPGSTTRA